jgi:hypothetical protein
LEPSDSFHIWATTNSGSTWTSQTLPRKTGALSAITCPSTSVCYGAGETFANGGSGGGVGDIVVTTDSGSDWSNQIIPSGANFYSSAACPSTTLCFAEGSATGTRGLLLLKGVGLSITTASLPDGTIGEPYSATLTAVGGDPPYTWRWAPGSSTRLPKGLKLDTKTGAISGTPSKTSTSSTFSVEVQDTKSKTKPPVQNTATATFTITIVAAA